MRKTIGDQAREFRLWKGWTYTRMAEEVQKHAGGEVVSRQKITQLEEKGDRQPRYFAALAKTMGTTMEALKAGKYAAGEDAPTGGTSEAPSVTIEQFDTGGSMGHGLLLRDQPGVIRSWTVSDEWLQQNVHRISSPKNLAIVTGFGPSMTPLFNPGDPLLVDRGVAKVDIDGVYFFRVGDEGFVKQVQRIPTADGLILRAKSYNPLYDPFDIVKGMDFEVFGRVVKVWKGEDF